MPGHFRVSLISLLAIAAVIILASRPASAGEIILSHNSGDGNGVFFIEGEPSMVLNGFDISPFAADYPMALDAVTISVRQAVPGVPIDLVIYEDENAGSPADATLVHHQQVTINRAGYNRIFLDQAAMINQSVIWVGFYLPVGFRFNADVSGPSVLTYWAWTPGGRFNVSDLSSAAVLGPGDGSEPVNINMEGIARISAELRQLQLEEMSAADVLGRQQVDDTQADTSGLQQYPFCGDLFYDQDDIYISGDGAFTLHCGVEPEFDAPTYVAQPSGVLLDVQRAGHLFKIDGQIDPQLHVQGATNTLPVPVTHCMRIPPDDLERAIIAEARGIPETWHVLPSVRFGDLVCAELTTASYLAYFFPRGDDSPQNVNLVLGWSKINPHPLECGLPAYVDVPLVNTGQSWFDTWSGDIKVLIEDVHVATGKVQDWRELKIPTSLLGPGMRHTVRVGPMIVDTYRHELHQVRVTVDYDETVEETNEFDNVWFSEYALDNAGGSQRCYDRSWLTATPHPHDVDDYCFVGTPFKRQRYLIWIPISKACKLNFRAGFVEYSRRRSRAETLHAHRQRRYRWVQVRRAYLHPCRASECLRALPPRHVSSAPPADPNGSRNPNVTHAAILRLDRGPRRMLRKAGALCQGERRLPGDRLGLKTVCRSVESLR